MAITRMSASELKSGSYIMIDGEPCVVLDLSKSKPGKHGSAKIRIDARGVFDGVRRSKIFRADESVEVPIIDKRTAQVVNVTPESVQLMDMESYEMFEIEPPEDEEIRSKLAPGIEVEYWTALGRRKIVRITGGV